MTLVQLDLAQIKRSCSACSLRHLCLPAPIDAADLSRLDALVRARRPLKTGESLYLAGAPLRSLFVVRSGSVKTFVEDKEGEAQILGFHLPGELVGLDALAEDAHQCHAVALEHTTICEVTVPQLLDVASQIPGFQRHLLRLQSRELVRDHEHLVLTSRLQALERVAAFLLALSRRYHHLGHPENRIQLSMARSDIANYLSLAIETVSRLFGKLSDMKVISVRRRMVHVLDFSKLHELAREHHQGDAEHAYPINAGNQAG